MMAQRICFHCRMIMAPGVWTHCNLLMRTQNRIYCWMCHITALSHKLNSSRLQILLCKQVPVVIQYIHILLVPEGMLPTDLSLFSKAVLFPPSCLLFPSFLFPQPTRNSNRKGMDISLVFFGIGWQKIVIYSRKMIMWRAYACWETADLWHNFHLARNQHLEQSTFLKFINGNQQNCVACAGMRLDILIFVVWSTWIFQTFGMIIIK